MLKLEGRDNVSVPCGKCPDCVKRRVSQWSFRLMQQERISDSSLFITLTYDTANIFITKKKYMGLNKRDLQLFFKRLRYDHTQFYNVQRPTEQPLSLKYYAVGEYGGRTVRPHYHVILFNAVTELIQPAWSLGDIHYGEVSGASIGYCLKYMSKTSRIPLHANDDRIPQFALMSKGLGKDYLTSEMIAWHLGDKYNRMYCNTLDNKKIAMPRYYKQRVYEENERKLIGEFLRKQKMEAELKDFQVNPDGYHSRNKAEAVTAAFKHMHAQAFKNQTL